MNFYQSVIKLSLSKKYSFYPLFLIVLSLTVAFGAHAQETADKTLLCVKEKRSRSGQRRQVYLTTESCRPGYKAYSVVAALEQEFPELLDLVGAVNAQGLSGEQGPQGSVGAQGAQGLQGPRGEPGLPGLPGKPGGFSTKGCFFVSGSDSHKASDPIAIEAVERNVVKLSCNADSELKRRYTVIDSGYKISSRGTKDCLEEDSGVPSRLCLPPLVGYGANQSIVSHDLVKDGTGNFIDGVVVVSEIDTARLIAIANSSFFDDAVAVLHVQAYCCPIDSRGISDYR